MKPGGDATVGSRSRRSRRSCRLRRVARCRSGKWSKHGCRDAGRLHREVTRVRAGGALGVAGAFPRPVPATGLADAGRGGPGGRDGTASSGACRRTRAATGGPTSGSGTTSPGSTKGGGARTSTLPSTSSGRMEWPAPALPDGHKRRGTMDPRGPTASFVPRGDARSSQTNRRVQHATVVGVDIAKRVFQLHWVDRDTGEIMNVRLSRTKFLEHFANRASCLIGSS